MKKTTKFGLLLTAAAAAIAMTFTGCEQLQDIAASFGKDDFYGHWKTLDYDDNNNPIEYYYNGQDYYQIEWEFDGTSENLFNAEGGTFKQHLTKYTDNTLSTKKNETYWTGAYKLSANSGYDKGKFILFYEFGVQLENTENKTVAKDNGTNVTFDDVYNWTNEDFLNVWKYGKTDVSAEEGEKGLALLADDDLQNVNVAVMEDGTAQSAKHGVMVQVRYADKENKKNPVCSDIEYFRFRLEDATVSGYGRMMATTMNTKGTDEIGRIYNKWITKDDYDSTDKYKALGKYSNTYGCPVYKGCSWTKMNFRCLARLSKGSGYTKYASKETKTNKQLFKITTGDNGNITSIDDSEDVGEKADDFDYSDIEK